MKIDFHVSISLIDDNPGSSFRGFAGKTLELPFVPYIGMEIIGPAIWDEAYTVKGVEFNVQTGSLTVRLGHDQYTAHMISLEVLQNTYAEDGWTLTNWAN